MKQNYNALILKSVKNHCRRNFSHSFCLLSKLKVQRYSWYYHNFKHSKYKKGTIQTALARGEAFCCALLVSFLCYNFFRLYNGSFWHLSINIHNTLPHNEVVISNRHGFCSHYTFFSRKNNEYFHDYKRDQSVF